jgi:hypothetical protein
MCLCHGVCVCVCVCACVRESLCVGDRKRDRDDVFLCVLVCVRERSV